MLLSTKFNKFKYSNKNMPNGGTYTKKHKKTKDGWRLEGHKPQNKLQFALVVLAYWAMVLLSVFLILALPPYCSTLPQAATGAAATKPTTSITTSILISSYTPPQDYTSITTSSSTTITTSTYLPPQDFTTILYP